MAVTADMKKKHYIKVNGEEIAYYKIDHDINGNPRYLVHFIDLGIKLEDYGKIKGLVKYRAKWFTGGYVIPSCYNLEQDLKYYLQIVKAYYTQKELDRGNK